MSVIPSGNIDYIALLHTTRFHGRFGTAQLPSMSIYEN